MSQSPFPPRRCYIRTTFEPNQHLEVTCQMLSRFVRQTDPDRLAVQPKHYFLFGSSNTSDKNILDIFLSDIPLHIDCHTPQHLQRDDLEVRLSQAHAATQAGQKVLQRCRNGGITAVVSGADDQECDEILLQESDYIIDGYTAVGALNHDWYWNTARSGERQNTVLTNPRYKMSKHDASKTRLSDRYQGYAWRRSSGCSHGNGGNWQCNRCGGKCKRDRCRVNPGEDKSDFEWWKLPEKGSKEWLSLSADVICERYRWQKAVGRHTVDASFLESIDSFSGD